MAYFVGFCGNYPEASKSSWYSSSNIFHMTIKNPATTGPITKPVKPRIDNPPRVEISIKAKRIIEWLEEGHRVKVDLFLRGRYKYMEFKFLKGKLEDFLTRVTVPFKIADEIKKSPKGLSCTLEKDTKSSPREKTANNSLKAQAEDNSAKSEEIAQADPKVEAKVESKAADKKPAAKAEPADNRTSESAKANSKEPSAKSEPKEKILHYRAPDDATAKALENSEASDVSSEKDKSKKDENK